MRTDEIREVFAVLAPELRALVAEHATDEEDEFMQRAVPDRGPGRALARAHRGVRRDLGSVPARHDRAPVRDDVRARRRPPDESLRRGRPHLALHRDARDAGTASTNGASARRSSERRSARAARRRSTSRRAGSGRTSSGARSRSGAGSTRACRRRSRTSSAACRSRASTAPSTALAARSSASTPTRRATGCTSSCASSSSRG